MLLTLHHIQLAMPKGGEDAAHSFYHGVLAMTVVPKPATLAGRGGIWFESGAIRLHLGVETDFVPARKAHPAFTVASLDATKAQLTSAGIAWHTDIDLPEFSRIYTADPFGNRIELLQLT
ncbi:VOC family protein [Pseudorhodobacter sp.]|uniref:VOC family protein n=1 Tax=Pseudorhodobacter sp. TaxID=1934400 RepID=UPI002648B2C1|nr:VOC family protein [Pseudorhodobacter sp.]MDN5785821.1 glyoxalase [Pseudorhodobacter sp.]